MLRTKILIPRSDLSLGQRKEIRDGARALAVRMAIAKAIGSSEDDLVVRPAENIADFATGIEQWNTSALVVLGNPYSVFPAAATPALANNKVAVFYGVGVETAPLPVSLLAFRQGAAGGTTFAIFDLEQLANELEPMGFFSEPVCYGPTDVLNISVIARIATGLLARVQLACYIAEGKATTLSG